MELTDMTMTTLKKWSGRSTWHTSHDDDMDLWYDFVNQYQNDHGFEIDEGALFEIIVSEVGDINEDLEEVIRDRISLAYCILDFLRRTGR